MKFHTLNTAYPPLTARVSFRTHHDMCFCPLDIEVPDVEMRGGLGLVMGVHSTSKNIILL